MSDTSLNFFDRLLPSVEFTFDLGDDIITAWGSWATALEIISVNDKIVSRKRSFRFKSPHEFTLRGRAYRLELNLRGPVYTMLRADLLEGDTLLERQECSLFGQQHRPSMMQVILLLLACGLAGTLVGFLAGYLIGGLIGSEQ